MNDERKILYACRRNKRENGLPVEKRKTVKLKNEKRKQ